LVSIVKAALGVWIAGVWVCEAGAKVAAAGATIVDASVEPTAIAAVVVATKCEDVAHPKHWAGGALRLERLPTVEPPLVVVLHSGGVLAAQAL